MADKSADAKSQAVLLPNVVSARRKRWGVLLMGAGWLGTLASLMVIALLVSPARYTMHVEESRDYVLTMMDPSRGTPLDKIPPRRGTNELFWGGVLLSLVSLFMAIPCTILLAVGMRMVPPYSLNPSVVRLINRPAIAFIVNGGIGSGLGMFLLAGWADFEVMVWSLIRLDVSLPEVSKGFFALLVLAVNTALLISGIQLHQRKGYRLAKATALLALVPGLSTGLPFAIWTLLTLRKPEVKAAFKKAG